MVREVAWRYICSKEKFHILFSDNDIDSGFNNIIYTNLFNGKEMKKTIAAIFIVFFSVLTCTQLCAQDAVLAPDRIIRVLVIDDKSSIHLRLDDKFKIFASGSDQLLMQGRELNTRLRVERNGFRIGSKDLEAPGLKIRVTGDYDIYIDGRRFRGDVEILHKDNGRMMIINYVGVEDYLLGVLFHEVSHRWPMECLKAQAIAARTFAIYQARANKMQPYDLRSDIYSQVYGGKNSERVTTTAAVRATKGKVLAFRGDIFPAYFHATCGGHTESASSLWKIDIQPLKGVTCDFCKDSKHYLWTKVLPLEDVSEILRQNGYKIGNIAAVRVISMTNSGRVDKMELMDDAGVTVVLTGKIFRGLLGPNVVRSTRFIPQVREGNLILEGRGWGHGVGLCQWGAYGQARKGAKVADILQYYYPGSEITTIDAVAKKL